MNIICYDIPGIPGTHEGSGFYSYIGFSIRRRWTIIKQRKIFFLPSLTHETCLSLRSGTYSLIKMSHGFEREEAANSSICTSLRQNLKEKNLLMEGFTFLGPLDTPDNLWSTDMSLGEVTSHEWSLAWFDMVAGKLSILLWALKQVSLFNLPEKSNVSLRS